jgi:ketosteroid isomerase-like protein
MLTREQALQHAQDWCDAFNRKDLSAILDFYADDVSVLSPLVERAFPGSDGLLVSKQSLKDYFNIGLKNPALHFQLIDVLLGHNAYTVLYRNHTGALVADCAELDDEGKIARMVATYGAASQ